MEKRINLPCGNFAERLDANKPLYTCMYCHCQIGSDEEPDRCRKMREDEDNKNFNKNDYWMDIDYEPEITDSRNYWEK